MQMTQRTKLDTFHRVLEFTASNRPTLANAPPGYAVQVQALQDAADAISAAAQDRGSGTPAYTAAQRRSLRATLRGQLVRMRRVARILERSVVGMPHLVNIPRRVASEQALLDAADGTVRDVAPYKDKFVTKGLSPDFLDHLTGSVQAILTARNAAAAAKRRRASARGTLHQAVIMGDDAVTCIDGIVRQACADDPVNGQATLTAWNAIIPPRSRAARVATHASVEAGSTASSTTASTSTATSTTTSTDPSTGGASA